MAGIVACIACTPCCLYRYNTAIIDSVPGTWIQSVSSAGRSASCRFSVTYALQLSLGECMERWQLLSIATWRPRDAAPVVLDSFFCQILLFSSFRSNVWHRPLIRRTGVFWRLVSIYQRFGNISTAHSAYAKTISERPVKIMTLPIESASPIS